MASSNAYNQEKEQVPVNMYFSSNEIKKNVLPKEDRTTAYIIFQNNELHTKLEALKKEMQEIVEERDDIERDVSSLTRTRTCLQGYVKNEYELAANWKLLATSYKEHLIKFEKGWALSCVVNMLFMCIICMINHHVFRNTLMSIYIPIKLALNGIQIHKLHVSWYKSEKNKQLIDIIEKIDKSNMYIQELVDNI